VAEGFNKKGDRKMNKKHRKFAGMMFILFVVMAGSLTLDSLGYNPLWALAGVGLAAVAIGIDILWMKRRKKAAQD